jgi:hypothetical protein
MTQNLRKQDWPDYLDRLSRAVVQSRSEAEVTALPCGLERDAGWVALVAVRYDAERDVLEIGFELADKTTEDYVITAPRAIAIDERDRGVAALEVTDGDGAAHRVELRKPVALA